MCFGPVETLTQREVTRQENYIMNYRYLHFWGWLFRNLSLFAAEEFPVVQLCKQSWFWETSVVTGREGRGLSNFSFSAFCFFGEVQNNEDHNLFNCPAYVRYFRQVMFSFHFGQFLTFTWNEITNFCHFIISYKAVGKVFLSLFFCHLWW